MITKDGKEVYPLRTTKITLGDQTIWALSERGKSWFILDLALGGVSFIPLNSTGFVTADGMKFTTPVRREGAI